MKCRKCGVQCDDKANFCSYCGAKLREKCLFCWVKESDSYDCGKDECPGQHLIVDEFRAYKEAQASAPQSSADP